MLQPNNPILSKMLERLFSAMLNGPSMNCRPHASRQHCFHDPAHESKTLRDESAGSDTVPGSGGLFRIPATVPV